jgi:hypothetical protein
MSAFGLAHKPNIERSAAQSHIERHLHATPVYAREAGPC